MNTKQVINNMARLQNLGHQVIAVNENTPTKGVRIHPLYPKHQLLLAFCRATPKSRWKKNSNNAKLSLQEIMATTWTLECFP